MGFQKKHQGEVNGEKTVWVIAGIPMKAPLKPVNCITSPQYEAQGGEEEEEEEEEEDLLQFTPKKDDAKFQGVLLCPPAPKKPRPPLRCRVEGVEFFAVPDDLGSVFIERA